MRENIKKWTEKTGNTEGEKAIKLGLENEWNQWEISKVLVELCKKADQHTEQARLTSIRRKA